MKYLLNGLMIGLFVSFISAPIFAAENLKRIPTVTLLVKQYADLENNLHQAIVDKNKKMLNEILANDFEERDSHEPNQPIPKEMWINKMINQPHDTYLMNQIAVRDFDNIRIVSFLLMPKINENIKDRPLFIVDVWKKTGENHQLLVRYSTA